MSRTMLRHTVVPLASAVSGMTVLAIAPTAGAEPPTDPAQLAGCDFARQYDTYDFTDYGDYNQRVLARSTGQFHDQFLASAAQRGTRAVATHTHSDVDAVECRTDSEDQQHANIVVTVDENTSSDATLGVPQPAHTVIMVALNNVNGQWLASQVNPLTPTH